MNKIGQYRYNSSVEYMTKIDNIKTKYLKNSQTSVEDLAFYLNEDTYFQESKMYYLNCSIQCIGGNGEGIKSLILKLITKDGKTEQYVQKFCYNNINGDLEVIFSPRIKDAYYLVLELERSVDRDFKVNIEPRRLQINKYVLYNVNNILDFDKSVMPAKVINKIGIQGSNGALFNINGESIILGQSGIYEITKDNFFITSLGISNYQKDLTNSFYLIIDYYYDDTDEKEV